MDTRQNANLCHEHVSIRNTPRAASLFGSHLFGSHPVRLALEFSDDVYGSGCIRFTLSVDALRVPGLDFSSWGLEALLIQL